ncbi:MAG: RNA polymerase sigma factor [Bacteroidota bacterium]
MRNILDLPMIQKLTQEKTSYKHLNVTMPIIDKEAQLISDLKKGERRAQEMFYVDYFPKMYPIAFRFSSSKEEAHEIINTAFLSVIKQIKNYGQGNFGGWVSTIVRRTAIDYYRKYNHTKPKQMELVDYDEVDYNAAISTLNMQDILCLVQQLPNATRTVFNLFVFDDMTHEEIAKKLSISKGTSKWHVSNGRSILTELFKKLNQGK